MSKELRQAIEEYPKVERNILCLIAKDQKVIFTRFRHKSKVRINSWSYCRVARAEFARA